MVLIDGIPEPRFAVESYSVTAPLAIRTARLAVDTTDDVPGVYAQWLGATVVVANPMRLTDGTLRWNILAHGVLKDIEVEMTAGRQQHVFELVDNWTDTLFRPSTTIWRRNSVGTLAEQVEGVIDIGNRANRSATKHTINGQQVHVLESGSGLRWTVADALSTVSAFSGLNLSLRGLPRDVANDRLLRAVDLTEPLAGTLERLLDDLNLTLERTLTREYGETTEHRAVLALSNGRPVRVAWADDQRAIGDVLSVEYDQPGQAARRWIVRANGWRIESTFELVGGWDPALEGEADSEYDKQDSTDFATYADVYRRWVLNEDGMFSLPPYNRGPAYDLTALFGMGEIDAQPLAFETNLTLGDDGAPLKPIVEISVNSGADWSLFPGSTDLLEDRAGVYLDTVTLPTPFLDAAKAGTARVRVTASVQSPDPLQIERRHGHAMADGLPPHVFELSDIFLFKRVAAQSIHHPDLLAGTLSADETDDTLAMHRWLVERFARHAKTTPNDGEATLRLAGAWPELRPGDRLMDARGPGVAADGYPQAVSKHGAIVRSVDVNFGTARGRGRTTTIGLVY